MPLLNSPVGDGSSQIDPLTTVHKKGLPKQKTARRQLRKAFSPPQGRTGRLLLQPPLAERGRPRPRGFGARHSRLQRTRWSQGNIPNVVEEVRFVARCRRPHLGRCTEYVCHFKRPRPTQQSCGRRGVPVARSSRSVGYINSMQTFRRLQNRRRGTRAC